MENSKKNNKAEDQKLTDIQIKNKLKKMSKSDLSRIIINLSARVDAHKAHNGEIKDAVDNIDMTDGFTTDSDYLNLLSVIDKEVK